MQENLDFLVHQFILMITNADLKVCDCLKCQKKLKGFGLQTEAKTAIAADHQTLLIGSEDTNGSDNGSFCLDNFVPEAVEPISKDISRDVHESRTQLVKVVSKMLA